MRKQIFLILIPLIIATLYLLPVSFNEMILRPEITLFQWIQPSEPLSEDIVLITIGDEDVRLLGGWPITRDYYSYAIYALNQSGAKTIGLDLFFSGPDKRYPRYDSTMADFLSTAGNVVLPMFFSELKYEDSKIVGINPHFSLPIINQSSGAHGFSNLGPDPISIKVPLCALSSEKLYHSFAVELVRNFEGKNYNSQSGKGRKRSGNVEVALTQGESLYLNYPELGEVKQRFSFVNFLQIFRNDPESINLKGKLAVIINTVTGVAQIKNTSLNDQVPASLVHVATVHNLLRGNWLKIVHPILGWLSIFLMGFIILRKSHVKIAGKIISLNSVIPLGFLILAIVVFLSFHVMLPLFYSLLSFGICAIIRRVSKLSTTQYETHLLSQELDQQLNQKEIQLETVRNELHDLNEKLSIETESSEKSLEQIEQQKQAIADLEKELADLQTYRNPVKKLADIDEEGIIYAKTSIMKNVMDMVLKVSKDNIPVLISGETGTGKEVIAQIIHKRSKRNGAPFVAVNCGALPETLLESELFGHEKGSFTGATSLRKGRFELAEGGTVFLDEVTETSPAFQSRLLRILQESVFERVGGQKEIKSDVRIIAATNKDIQKLIDKEKFRSDLFYRLNGFPIAIPPLRERKDDIALLADHFIKKHGYAAITGFSSQAMQLLNTYSWPGNVRELENCVRRAAILAQSEGRSMIQEEDLSEDVKKKQAADHLQLVHKPLEDQILDLMRSFKFSRSAIVQTANLLGNRDRGTITEYVKGICFQQIVESEFKLSEAIKTIAGSTDEILLENVQQKIKDYLTNLKNYSGLPAQADIPTNEQAPPFRGLPKKFDPFLDQILANLPHLVEQL